ncbi:hypothetical protein P3339_09380 [Microbulbifer sp. MLAF003]|uniref:hypothetical protein n=1 Tax=Microbulbifer sp. MLAF003 TaxID=3032582 RepID=UPI0024AD3DAC|nr:hypothetical protein [Microbulbifer sp. MLAF003]WHI52952.1 hypothetical protein P3339_09380 [Microbulbifer sp. MLAF003]
MLNRLFFFFLFIASACVEADFISARGELTQSKTISNISWKYEGADVIKFLLYRRGWSQAKWEFVSSFTPEISSYLDRDEINSERSWRYRIVAKTISGDYVRYFDAFDLTKLYASGMNRDLDADFWMSVPAGSGSSLSNGRESRLEIKNISRWSSLAGQLDGVVVYRSAIIEASDEELVEFSQAMKSNGIKIAIEINGLSSSYALHESEGESLTGEESFSSNYTRSLKRFVDLGGEIDTLIFDGPIRRVLYPSDTPISPHTYQSIGNELVDTMRLWRSVVPKIKFVLLTNFSNWGWKGQPARNSKGLPPQSLGYGNYDEALREVLGVVRGSEVDFDAVAADYNYDAFLNEGYSNQVELVKDVDYKNRLIEFYHVVKDYGYQFNMIINSARGAKEGNHPYRVEVLNYIHSLIGVGVNVDSFVIQSWGSYPSLWLTENTTGTMTWTTRLALERVRNGVDVAPGY